MPPAYKTMTTYHVRAEIADGRSWIDVWQSDDEINLMDTLEYAYTNGDFGYPPNVARRLGIPEPENGEDESLRVRRLDIMTERKRFTLWLSRRITLTNAQLASLIQNYPNI